VSPPDQETEVHYEGDYWEECSLRVVLTDPPTFELQLPGEGARVVRLRAGHFFNVAKFTLAFVEATLTFPPLPNEKPGAFLMDVFRRLLADRVEVPVAEEAGNRGTMLGDIRLAIAACPEAEDPRDIDRGLLYPSPEGAGAWVNARSLMARTARGCPVKFTPAEFYSALVTIGLSNLGPRRRDGWQGRVWLVPPSLLPVAPARMNGAASPELQAPVAEQGAFDDLL
jgi:hypothetical protein